MSRYVDLDEEIKAMYFDEEHEEWNLKEETIESALNHVDYYNVFELVRCKDCKCYARNKNTFHRGSDCLKGNICTIVPDRDFCSRAERVEQ